MLRNTNANDPRAILRRFIEMPDNEFIFHDVVEDCIDPYTGQPLLDGSETSEEKFHKFRESAFDYDADVSIEAMTVSKAVYREITMRDDWQIRPQEKYWYTRKSDGKKHLHNREGLLFELKSSEMDYLLRGDTMNSVATTNKRYREVYGKDAELPEYAEKLMGVYQTFGNFFLIPYKSNMSLNAARGVGESRDYFDLFLMAVYNFFMDNGPDVEDKVSSFVRTVTGEKSWALEKVFGNPELAEFYASYLTEYYGRDGKRSWNRFVEFNILFPYVETDSDETFGRPQELWTGHFSGSVKPEVEEQFLEFYRNTVDHILWKNLFIQVILSRYKKHKICS